MLQLTDNQLMTLREFLKEEDELYANVIKPDGYNWDHAFLRSFYDTDRGYESARHLYEILYEHSRKLQEITDYEAGLIPAMAAEQAVMRRLESERLQPVGELLLKKVPENVNERGRLRLTEHEFAQVTDDLGSIRNYFSFRDGLNTVRHGFFVDGMKLSEIVKKYWSENQRFEGSWYDKYIMPSDRRGAADRKAFSMITFFAVDAHDGTMMPKLLSMEKNMKSADVATPLLTEELPMGKEKVILRKDINKIVKIITSGNPRRDACTANNLKRMLNLDTIQKYNRKIERILFDLQQYLR